MHQSYFLMTDDTDSGEHSFTVKSSSAQTVYLSTNTWPTRTYPEDCAEEIHQAVHRTLFGGINMGWYYRYGIEAIEVSENEVLTLEVNMDWRLNSAKDFSLVAWSTVSPVEIIADADADLVSASWPFTTMRSDGDNNSLDDDDEDEQPIEYEQTEDDDATDLINDHVSGDDLCSDNEIPSLCRPGSFN